MTLGLYGLGQVYDLFVLRRMVEETNTKLLGEVKYASPIFISRPSYRISVYHNAVRDFDNVGAGVKCEYCDAMRDTCKRCANCGAA